MLFKLINAWVTYATSSSNDVIYHSSIIIHQSQQDAIDYILAEAETNKDNLSTDYDGDELIGASVPHGDDMYYAQLCPANPNYNRNIVNEHDDFTNKDWAK